mmetsp:Transcript_111740/g.322954  ORF Transcript_111740/g.322954 Transcript_111740/m.322954 type:complete len:202 (-) Transcript_111740:349-954(-)
MEEDNASGDPRSALLQLLVDGDRYTHVCQAPTLVGGEPLALLAAAPHEQVLLPLAAALLADVGAAETQGPSLLCDVVIAAKRRGAHRRVHRLHRSGPHRVGLQVGDRGLKDLQVLLVHQARLGQQRNVSSALVHLGRVRSGVQDGHGADPIADELQGQAVVHDVEEGVEPPALVVLHLVAIRYLGPADLGGFLAVDHKDLL